MDYLSFSLGFFVGIIAGMSAAKAAMAEKLLDGVYSKVVCKLKTGEVFRGYICLGFHEDGDDDDDDDPDEVRVSPEEFFSRN